MESIGKLVFYPMIEEEESFSNIISWEKQTIKYVIENRSRMLKIIKSMAKGKISSMDVEDIYSSLIEYLFKCGDYDPEIPKEKSKSDSTITLEAYVNSCAKNCVKRFITDSYRRNKDIIKDSIISEDGKELSFIDNVVDSDSTDEIEECYMVIDEFLSDMEHKRYEYGIDLFLVIYVRLVTMEKNNSVYKSILELLGINKNKLAILEKNMKKDQDIISALKAMSMCDNSVVKEKLENYVYCIKIINQSLEHF